MDDFDVTNPAEQASAAAPAPEVTNAPAADKPADELDESGQPIEGQAAGADDDSEEVEHEGQKYRIPKALKPALLMQADYTRKTQELAEQRRAAEAERAQARQVSQERLQAMARVVALDERIAAYGQTNWQSFSQNDPVAAQAAFMEFQQVKDARASLAAQLQQHEQQEHFEAQRQAAKRAEEGQAVLQRDIKGWGPELARQLSYYAVKEMGFQPQDIAQVADPRAVKLLHAAWLGHQVLAKQQQKPLANDTAAPKPVTKVTGSSAPARRDMNTLSTDDWMRARTEQLRKKGSR